MAIGINPPQVADQKLQATLTALWRSDPHPAYLAAILAKYAHQEPSLLSLVQALLPELDAVDRGLVLSRLMPKSPTTKTEAAGRPEWYREWLSQNNWPPKPPLEIRVDPELGRLAIGLKKTGEYWVWAVARHFFGQPGWAERLPLYDSLKTAGVIQTRRHFNRLLAAGAGLFWGLSHGGRVYLRSYIKVSRKLTEMAVAANPRLVTTNIPGVRDVYLAVGGSLGDVKARIYAGWLTHREAPTIARETLCQLFAVSEDTIRNWEARLGDRLAITTNYAQTGVDPKEDDTLFHYLPEHSYDYLTKQGQVRVRWRLPNTYHPHHIRQHPHKGQSRKARTAAALTAWFQPVEFGATTRIRELAFDRSHRELRRYFETDKQLRRLLIRLTKRGAAQGTVPRYVFRGEDRNGHHIYELSLDGEVMTTASERASIRRETAFLAQQRRKHRVWLSKTERG